MASSYTPNYNLDLYGGNSKPNLADEYNSAIDKIDSQMKKNETDNTLTSNNLAAAITRIDGHDTAITDINGEITTVKQDVQGNTESINALQTGKAPTMHASDTTNYGQGSNTLFGHVKLSDATDSTSGQTGGVAATPNAVKTVANQTTAIKNDVKTVADQTTAIKNSLTFDPSNSVGMLYSDPNVVIDTSGSSSVTGGSVRYAPSNDGTYIKVYGYFDLTYTHDGSRAATMTFKGLIKKPPEKDYTIDVMAYYIGKDASNNVIYNIGACHIKSNGDFSIDIWLTGTNVALKVILFPFMIYNKSFGDTGDPQSRALIVNLGE